MRSQEGCGGPASAGLDPLIPSGADGDPDAADEGLVRDLERLGGAVAARGAAEAFVRAAQKKVGQLRRMRAELAARGPEHPDGRRVVFRTGHKPGVVDYCLASGVGPDAEDEKPFLRVNVQHWRKLKTLVSARCCGSSSEEQD